VAEALLEYPQAVAVSAERGKGMDDLLAQVEGALREGMVVVRALLPYSEAELLHLLHEWGSVEREEHTEQGTLVVGRAPAALAERMQTWSVRA
jgi:GTP-binding protein HflX